MTITVKKIDEYRWEIPKTGAMRVPGMVYSTAAMLEGSPQKEPLKQVANVATLPGNFKGIPCHAGHALGIWIPHRRCRRL